jgi:predicted transcriptional regulator
LSSRVYTDGTIWNSKEADQRILSALLVGLDVDGQWGRQLHKNLAGDLEYSRQYLQNRLQMLNAAGLIANIGGGLYEITDDGIDRAI